MSFKLLVLLAVLLVTMVFVITTSVVMTGVISRQETFFHYYSLASSEESRPKFSVDLQAMSEALVSIDFPWWLGFKENSIAMAEDLVVLQHNTGPVSTREKQLVILTYLLESQVYSIFLMVCIGFFTVFLIILAICWFYGRPLISRAFR